eukprot:1183418-Prorocentrum_minimum.AAC.8
MAAAGGVDSTLAAGGREPTNQLEPAGGCRISVLLVKENSSMTKWPTLANDVWYHSSFFWAGGVKSPPRSLSQSPRRVESRIIRSSPTATLMCICAANEIIQMLLDHGADLNHSDYCGATALTLAAFKVLALVRIRAPLRPKPEHTTPPPRVARKP